MKKSAILFFSFFLGLMFISCSENNQDDETFNLKEQSELMQQDQVAMDYFEAISLSFKVANESDMGISGLRTYQNILEREGGDHCNIKMESFNGNIDLEKYAEVKCYLAKVEKKFRDKYPHLKDMKKSDKAKLFTPLIKSIPLDIDMEIMKKKGEAYYEKLSEEEKIKLQEEAKKKLNLNNH